MNFDKVYIIAEVSANHNQDIEIAKRSIEEAKKSGADCVKFQAYTPEKMCLNTDYKVQSGPWKGEKYWDLYSRAYMPLEWHPKLKEHADKVGIDYMASVFDKETVDLIDPLVKMHKIASFEVTDLELIEYVENKDKPVLVSMGCCAKDEIPYPLFAGDFIFMSCSSDYPASIKDYPLGELGRFYSWGISDHTLDDDLIVVAVGRGAKVVERHFTIDGGVDRDFSDNPQEFALMVEKVRKIETAMGTELPMKGREFMRSVWVTKDIKDGEEVTRENTKVLRPNIGICADKYQNVLGQKVNKDIKKGTPLTNGDL